jgi:hypothetical protein
MLQAKGPGPHVPDWINGEVETTLQQPTRLLAKTADLLAAIHMVRDALRYAQEKRHITNAHYRQHFSSQLRTFTVQQYDRLPSQNNSHEE